MAVGEALLKPLLGAMVIFHRPWINRRVAERLLIALACTGAADKCSDIFFNLHDCISVPGTVGSEHPELHSVRSEAVATIAEPLKGTLLKDV